MVALQGSSLEGKTLLAGGRGLKSSISRCFLIVLGSWPVARDISVGLHPFPAISLITSIWDMLSKIPSSFTLLFIARAKARGGGTAFLQLSRFFPGKPLAHFRDF